MTLSLNMGEIVCTMNSIDIDELKTRVIRYGRVRDIREYFIKKRLEEEQILRFGHKYIEFVKDRTV